MQLEKKKRLQLGNKEFFTPLEAEEIESVEKKINAVLLASQSAVTP